MTEAHNHPTPAQLRRLLGRSPLLPKPSLALPPSPFMTPKTQTTQAATLNSQMDCNPHPFSLTRVTSSDCLGAKPSTPGLRSSVRRSVRLPSLHTPRYRYSLKEQPAALGSPFLTPRRTSISTKQVLPGSSRREVLSARRLLDFRSLSPMNRSEEEEDSDGGAEGRDWCCCSRRGIKRTEMPNQDAYFLRCPFPSLPSARYFGVADGHGAHGHFVSNFVAKSLPLFLEQKLLHLATGHTDKAPGLFEDVFQRTSRVLAHQRFDSQNSGSSACTVLIWAKVLFCANTGDSRAVLGSYRSGHWQASPLSKDHKCSDPEERRRIHANGGRVATLRGNLPRVYYQDKLEPGLALTRSLGDSAAGHIGVIAEPDVKRVDLTPSDRFVIVASDGIWDKLSNSEAVSFVGTLMSERTPEQAARMLVKKAYSRWGGEAARYMDDLTAVVVYI